VLRDADYADCTPTSNDQQRYLVAEIPITRKERRNIWPALIGILALVIVLGFLFGRRHVTRPGLATDTTSSTTSATSTGSVADTSHHP
jgi:LPXTG-motif cell wall-anchored protein